MEVTIHNTKMKVFDSNIVHRPIPLDDTECIAVYRYTTPIIPEIHYHILNKWMLEPEYSNGLAYYNDYFGLIAVFKIKKIHE